MSSFVSIGRHEFPVNNVLAAQQCVSESGELLPEWDVYLIGGLRFRLTAAEKILLDKERESHAGVVYLNAMINNLQQAQRAQ